MEIRNGIDGTENGHRWDGNEEDNFLNTIKESDITQVQLDQQVESKSDFSAALPRQI